MNESVVVNARCGGLKGAVLRSFEGYDYCAFKGIPYAKPPVGELRFRDPVPLEPWTGIKEVVDYGPSCSQYNFMNKSTEGEEDCLYLNVFVKTINENARLPVMVWIHGGAFIMGSGDDLLYGPDYLLKKDVVLVTFNYRLGVVGFLNFDNEVAPGNQGLKDQIMALKWVQENIANFGGDRDNVTIFGESAGGASVHYLTMSPLSKGLFHKAIAQSGVACNPWACASNAIFSYKLCEVLGNNSTDPEELVRFLRTVDVNKLIEAQEAIRSPDEKLSAIFPFGPGADSKSKQPFLPIHPSKAAEHGAHIPMILGCNTHEGIFSLLGFKNLYDKLNTDFERYVSHPVTLELLQRCNLTPNELKRLYYGDEKISGDSAEIFVDLWSDIQFIEGIHKVVKAQVRQNSAPIYFYRFTYDKQFSIIKSFNNTHMRGTAHFDEVQLLFSMKLYDLLNIELPKPGTATYKMVEKMVTLWYNFAKYGRPTITTSDLITSYWLPVIDEKMFRTLNINEDLRMENTLNIEERYSFGKHLKNKL